MWAFDQSGNAKGKLTDGKKINSLKIGLGKLLLCVFIKFEDRDLEVWKAHFAFQKSRECAIGSVGVWSSLQGPGPQ